MRLFDPSVPFMCVAWLASLPWRLFLSGPLVRIKPNERGRQAAFSVSSPSSTNPDHSYKGREGGDLFKVEDLFDLIAGLQNVAFIPFWASGGNLIK